MGRKWPTLLFQLQRGDLPCVAIPVAICTATQNQQGKSQVSAISYNQLYHKKWLLGSV